MPFNPPNSAVMLAMAKRESVESCRTPSPRYSTDRSMATVLRPSSARVRRITSLPPNPNGSCPLYSTLIASGTSIQDVPSTMATTMSAPPSPMETAPRPPCDEVCESAPSTTSLGRTRSR